MTGGMAAGLTGAMAARIAARPVLSDADRGTAAQGVADCVAVLLAGWKDPVAAQLRQIGGIPDWADPLASPIAAAGPLALHLGIAAHVLDFDDTAFGGHPSAVLVPTILAAVAERPASGAAMLDAYGAGYETWGELSLREPDSVHGKGWHPSAVYGPVAATASLANLRGADAETTATALALAASMAGGVVAQFGTPAKPWHIGRAAAAAFEALALAEAGMTAAPDALEHPLGFLAAISPNGNVRRDGPLGWGGHMAVNGLSIKRYPVCYANHRALDGLAGLLATAQVPVGATTAIEAHIGTHQANMLRHMRPQTPAEAKFSLPFAMAAMALRGRLTLRELAPEFITSDAVQAFLPKVRVEIVEGRHRLEPSLSPYDRVVVRLDSGEVLDSGEIDLPLGHGGNPAPASALDDKVSGCLALGPVPQRAAEIRAVLADLPALTDTRALIAHRKEASHG